MNNNFKKAIRNNEGNLDRKNKTTSKNFNKLAANAVKGYDFKNGKNSSKGKYKTEKEYQSSFDDILKFQKQYTDAQKKQINLVIFHDDNNDGVVSAYISWRYLVNDNKKDVKFLPMKPSHGRNVDKRVSNLEDQIKDKHVLILDLAYSDPTFDYIKNKAKSMIVIDDHAERVTYKDKNVFVGDGHAAVAYTWKFFYPNKEVPKFVQYVDDSDAKLFLPFISYSNLVSVSLGFRFVHNIFKSMGSETFEELHQFFKDDNINFWIFLGKYFEEVRDHLKNQIAANARAKDFQGYRVGVLNFGAPGLIKPVLRQIITNFKKRGEHIDFAVAYSYEYTANPPSYRVTIIDDHQQTKLNMGEIAEKLGKIGGHPKLGGGHTHVGNFYWSKDINDLFRTRYI